MTTTSQAPAEILKGLHRVRWAVRGTLLLGVAASIAANVLHADPHPVSQGIAAWPPLALLVTVELIARVPVHRQLLAIIRIAVTAGIAGIAAWVSYFHMADVVRRYGETSTAAHLLPLSVDGLIVVASICLIEIAGRIRAHEHTSTDPAPAADSIADITAPSRTPHAEPRPQREKRADSPLVTLSSAASRSPSLTTPADPPPVDASGTAALTPQPRMPATPEPDADAARPQADTAATTTTAPTTTVSPVQHQPPDTGPALADDSDTVPEATKDAVAYWSGRDPHLHPSEIGRLIGKSERTVRRYLPEGTPVSKETLSKR
ncbi:DUF2637 domain-containing protein [Actinoplanes sp. NPDC051475]|uniref:DUF2637 domain-containing protein n=1 Tax=Actinoplanes sp. NPDC051475 TaxID=3157225 RepID=UPI00344B9250